MGSNHEVFRSDMGKSALKCGLYCNKACLCERDLNDGKVYMSSNFEKNLLGKVGDRFSGIRQIVLWPKELGVHRMNDVLERFGIKERWRIVFEE